MTYIYALLGTIAVRLFANFIVALFLWPFWNIVEEAIWGGKVDFGYFECFSLAMVVSLVVPITITQTCNCDLEEIPQDDPQEPEDKQ